MEFGMAASWKLKVGFPHDPATALLSIDPKDSKSTHPKHLHIIVCCSTIHNNQITEPTTHLANLRGLDKENGAYIHSGIFPAVKNQVMLLKEKQPETIILRELSQFQKDKRPMVSLVCSSRIFYRWSMKSWMNIWKERENKRGTRWTRVTNGRERQNTKIMQIERDKGCKGNMLSQKKDV